MEQQQFLKYYQNFVSYCKTAFPSIPAPFYTEWLRDTNLIFPSEPPLLPTAYSQQLPPNNKTVTLVITTTAQRRPQSCQIQLIRRKVVVMNKRKSVKAGASNKLLFW